MKYISLLVLLLFFSCSSLTKNEVKGNYEYRTEISKGNLVLSDNYFEYSYNAPMESYESKGKWSLNDNILVLKSYESFKNNFIIVEEILNSHNSFVRMIQDDGTPIVGAIIIINTDLIFYTNELGEINLNNLNDDVNKIEVEFIDLPKENSIYKPKNNMSKSFIIKVVPKYYNKIYYNDSIRIKRNKIKIFKQEYIKR